MLKVREKKDELEANRVKIKDNAEKTIVEKRKEIGKHAFYTLY